MPRTPETPPRPSEGEPLAPSGLAVPVGGGEVRKDPPSFTAGARERFVILVGDGRTRSEAGRLLGVSPSTVHRALKASTAFREAVEIAEGATWDIAESALRKAVEDEQPWAIRFALTRAAGLRDRWKESASELAVSVTAEIGPGLERVRALEAALTERREILGGLDLPAVESDVLDLESEEASPG